MPPPCHLPGRAAPLVGGALGLLFFGAVYGFHIVDPRHIGWLLQGDPAQHYLGFAFFRQAPWTWPIGLIPSMGAAGGTSVVFTDSIPLLAVPFKAISSWLPGDFQYFGGWMLACYVAYGAWGLRVLLKLGLPWHGAVAATLLLLTSPALALRAYGHESLMAHWLLLASLDLHLSRQPAGHWVLLCAGSLIHPYWVPMLAPLAVLDFVRHPVNWRVHLLGVTGFAGGLGLVGHLAGPRAQLSAEGYGFYSANLATLVDPMNWAGFLRQYSRPLEGGAEWSRLLGSTGQATAGQYEGFAYLGAGVLALLALAAGHGAVARKTTGRPTGLGQYLSLAALLAVFALSSQVTAGDRTLVSFELPPRLAGWFAVFRSTGRFVWPLALGLTLWALATLAARLPPRHFLVAALSALALQAVDLSGKWGEFRHRFTAGSLGSVAVLDGPGWDRASCLQRLVVLPAKGQGDDWIAPALFAARHQLSVNLAYTARADARAIEAEEEREWQALSAAAPRQDTAYLVRQPDLTARLTPGLLEQVDVYPGPEGALVMARRSGCIRRQAGHA